MPDYSEPARPARRIAPGRGSLAFAAAQTPVARWAGALEEALAAASELQRSGFKNASNPKPGITKCLNEAEGVAERLFAPLQHIILTQFPKSLTDAVVMLSVAHDLTEDVGAIDGEHPELAADLQAVHLATAGLIAFLLTIAGEAARSGLPTAVGSTVTRALDRAEARFLSGEAA